ncbi:MAG: glycoside hydrolase family 2 protein [Acidimicrobiales bacterium]
MARPEGTPRADYPRPQAQRPTWLCLNGDWGFELDPGDSGLERQILSRALDDTIVVPFAPESAYSGIGNTDFLRSVWYRKEVRLPPEWAGRKILLHFQAVDYEATVFVNGTEAGRHRGGYTPFTCDITHLTSPASDTVIVVRARDEPGRAQPRGKQSERFSPYGSRYPRTTGIWQTVWLEPVPDSWLSRPRITPNLHSASFQVGVRVHGSRAGLAVRCTVADARGDIVTTVVPADVDFTPSATLAIPPGRVRLWTLDDPHLYTLRIRLEVERTGEVVDELSSYAGLRSLAAVDGVMLLNGEPCFQRLVLDQGHWPGGGLTAPSDEMLAGDIVLAKAAGFNGARAHERVPEERWLYHCDRLGYLVWAEFPDWGNRNRGSEQDHIRFPIEYATQWLEVLERDYSHPCIVAWCALNETEQRRGAEVTELDDATLGLFLAARLADQTRPVLDVSGYTHRLKETDLIDCHDYEQDPAVFADHLAGGPAAMLDRENEPLGYTASSFYEGQPFFVSEFGGSLWTEEPMANETNEADGSSWGYGRRPGSKDELLERFTALCTLLLDDKLVAGYCYTQLTDTYQEANGLFTFERVPKLSLERMHAVQSRQAVIERPNEVVTDTSLRPEHQPGNAHAQEM